MLWKLMLSEEMFGRSCKALAGGVGSQVRSVAEPVLFYTHGKGSKIYDVDGNEYIDYLLGYGPLILGHAHPSIVKAVKEQMERGTQFGGETEFTVQLAEKLTRIIPCAELVKFNNSGSEAVHAALRLARAYTGKSKVVKFEGHYHGWMDGVYVSHLPDSLELIGMKNAPRRLLGSAGQPESVLQDLIIMPWNDLEIVERVIRERKFEIAAVITEPIMSNCGVIMPREGYLQGLREITEENGVLLIFDEVITGFRVALGGAQEYFGVIPDLSTFGKAVGGGLPISGYGGREDIMRLVAEKKVVHAGTYNTNAIAVSGSLAAVSELERDSGKAYKHLTRTGKKLMKEIGESAEREDVPLRIQGPGPMFGTTFMAQEIWDLRDSLQPHPDLYPQFRRMLLEKGIHIFPSEKGLWYISTAHTEEDAEKTLSKVEDVLGKLKE